MDIESKKWEIMYTNDDIHKRLKEMAIDINRDFKNKKLLVISLLKGSFIFCADLIRYFEVPVKVNFMTTSSYGNGYENSGVKIVSDVTTNIEGYDVLVVDDITDSAITMDFVVKHLKKKNPASIKTCVLLDKPSRRKVDLVPDYCGFEIEDKFVVGYGFDFEDYYRNIPYIFNVVTD